jgi:hypothetical protein
MGLPPGHPITGIEMASLKTDLSNVGAKLADEQVLVARYHCASLTIFRDDRGIPPQSCGRKLGEIDS